VCLDTLNYEKISIGSKEEITILIGVKKTKRNGFAGALAHFNEGGKMKKPCYYYFGKDFSFCA
jgi:hypothetical protein